MDYAAALIEQNRLLAELTRAAEPSTPVPSCPDWTLRQLVTHVGRGHRLAATIVADRAAAVVDPRSVADGKPPADADGTAAWLRDGAQAVLDAVDEVGGDVAVWTFTGPQPAPWWVRRRLHESAVHRADAAHALGVAYELESAVAADGVSEWLTLLSARPAAAGPPPLDEGATLHLHATDEGLGPAGEWMVRSADGRVTWETGHAKGAAAVRGRALDLLLGMLRRPAGELEVLGDTAVWSTWLQRTPF